MSHALQDNLDLVKLKTSRAKKTLRSLVSFMNERVNLESRYAQALHSLAKTGKTLLLSNRRRFHLAQHHRVQELRGAVSFTR